MATVRELLAQATASLKTGQLAEAHTLCQQVLSERPFHGHGLHLLGLIEHQRGHHATAIEHLRESIRYGAAKAKWHFHLGVAYRTAGRLDEAILSYEHSLKLNSNDAEAQNNLGAALMDTGQAQQAAACFRRALALNDAFADAHANLGVACYGMKQYEAALTSLKRAVELDPSIGRYHFLLGNAYTARQQFDRAANSYERSIELDPKQHRTHNNLGIVRHQQGQLESARDCYRRALRIRSDYAEAHRNLGNVLRQLGDWDQALKHLNRVRRLRPNSAEAAANAATIYEMRGEYDRAWRILQPLVDAQVDNIDVALAFSTLCRHVNQQARAMAMLERLLSQMPDKNYRQMNLHFALARLLDRQGEYDTAMEHFQQANAKKAVQFDIGAHKTFVDELIRVYGKRNLKKLPRAECRGGLRPIFIVGMPRSGTSLVEQIVCAHPDVYGAGESDAMSQLTRGLAKALDTKDSYPGCVLALTEHVANDVAERYLDVLRESAGDANRVTDKMPANCFHLGLISLLFPDAYVIECRRHPLDTCLSCYGFNFGGHHPYAYDLENLGRYYRQYDRLMKHYKRVLDIPLLTVHYEQLVAKPEPQIRELIQFCGLRWRRSCLTFHEAKRDVSTASYDQVRQPIYTSSVGRWRHYEQHLRPLIKGLGRSMPQ